MSGGAIIVPDSSPLITLAAAGALDLLLAPGLPVVVPDGVHWETVRHADRPGAADIVDWLQRRRGAVLIGATQEFANHQLLVEAGVRRIANMGERCAVEIVDLETARDPSARAVMIYEDSDVNAVRLLNPDRVATLTTADFLFELEAARLIQSADHVLDLAVAAGRVDAVRGRRGSAARLFGGESGGA